MHAGQTVRRNAAGYLSEANTSVMSISFDNNGDIYRCIMNFIISTVTSSDASIDPDQPAFNFTWVSSPLVVHCKYSNNCRIAYCIVLTTITRNPEVIWEEPHPLTQRMDSSAACASSCAMPTVDETNHSAAGMLHPHCTATFFLYFRPTLCCLIPFYDPLGFCPGLPGWAGTRTVKPGR